MFVFKRIRYDCVCMPVKFEKYGQLANHSMQLHTNAVRTQIVHFAG